MSKGIDLDNVSYATFMYFDEEKFRYYKNIGQAMVPNPTGLKAIVEWPYGKVKELQMMFTETVTIERIPNILAFAYTTTEDRTPKEFLAMKWHEVFRLYNHIYSEVGYIVDREKVLAYEPSADEEEAGIDRFARFGTMGTIDTLAAGNVLLYDEIEAKPYRLIFAKLYLESEKTRYQKNMLAIQRRRDPK